MDGGFHTVVHFQVQLGKQVMLVHRSVLDISHTTGINNVANNKALDGLVLRNSLSRRDAPNALDMASALLVAAVIASFNSHFRLDIQALMMIRRMKLTVRFVDSTS